MACSPRRWPRAHSARLQRDTLSADTRISQQILEAVSKIKRPGSFCSSGRLPGTFPGLEVEGVGQIALPLGESRAASLRNQANLASANAAAAFFALEPAGGAAAWCLIRPDGRPHPRPAPIPQVRSPTKAHQGISAVYTVLPPNLPTAYSGGMSSACQDIAVLERLLDPIRCNLTPSAARELVELRADPATKARLEELADKCTEGRLTEAEQREYDAYVKAQDFIGVLQAKAGAVLRASEGYERARLGGTNDVFRSGTLSV